MEEHTHDHSAHAAGGMTMGADHGHGSAFARRTDGSYYYTHGAFLGHVVPGTFFILWGSWWLFATFYTYLRAAAARRPFSSRPWYPVPWGSNWFRRIPLEPIVKIALPCIGILGELWLGHPSWRTLIAADGKFVTDNINDWQHSTMYAAFAASGLMDVIGHFSSLPAGIERAFLGLAFLSEGLLLVFHLKGPHIEVLVHLITVLQVFATVVAIAVEAALPESLPAAATRPAVTILQGVWWVQTAYIMYMSDPAYDPDEMGGAMMTPVVMVAHMLWVAVGSVMLFLVMRAAQARLLGREIGFAPLKTSERVAARYEEHEHDIELTNGGRAVELSGLAGFGGK